MRGLARGAGAGSVATVAMSVVMLAAQRLGATPQPEPEAITEAGVSALGLDVSKGRKEMLAAAAHLAYGAAMGSFFAVLAPKVPVAPSAKGPVFGLFLAVASYEGWVPAAGILPALHAQAEGRRRQLLLAHLLYGSVLGRLVPSR
jgi:hypothetical protein